MRQETDKDVLYKHRGCEGCTRKCQYNALTATKEVAESDKGKFECNDGGKI